MIRCSCPLAKCEECDYRGRYPTRQDWPVHSRLLFELHGQKNGLYPSRSVICLRGSSAGASLCCIQPHACTCAQADTCMRERPSSIRLWIQVCLFTFPPYVILNSSHCLREEIKTMLIKQYSAYFLDIFALCRHTSVFSHSLSLERSLFFSLSPLWVHFPPLICVKSAPSLLLLFKLFSHQVSMVPRDILAALHPPTS